MIHAELRCNELSRSRRINSSGSGGRSLNASPPTPGDAGTLGGREKPAEDLPSPRGLDAGLLGTSGTARLNGPLSVMRRPFERWIHR
jgi:hypothetical protein